MIVENIAGDFAIKDLTPKTTNIGDRIVKNLRICGSGIYTYRIDEAPLLHLDPIPEQYKNLQYINVYRPAEVLTANKDLFARVPIITGHHIKIDRDNAKQFTVGMVGDSVSAEVDSKDGETYLYTTGTIVAGDGVRAYEQFGQLSVGYDPIMEWCEEPGEHNGVAYQAVLKGFNDINHLLICKVARGGPQCMVMDSLDDITPLQRFVAQHHGGIYMGVFQKIFGKNAPKQTAGDAVVTAMLQSIALGADAEATVKKIREVAGDAIKGDMNDYLDELSKSKGEKPEDIEKAVGIVVDAWQKQAGDEFPPEKKDEEKKPDEKKPEEKKDESAGDEPEPKKDESKKDDKSAGDGCNSVPPKAAGDEGIDYEKLAAAIVAKQTEAQKQAGDEIDEKMTAEQIKQLSVAITGDESKDSCSSDDILKSIF